MTKPEFRQIWQRIAYGAGVAFALTVPMGAHGAVQGIGVSPTSVDLKVDTAGTYHGDITVINDGENDVNYKIFASDYRVNDESYLGDFSSAGAKANVSPVSWFNLPVGIFTVKSRTQGSFGYTINVPPTAAVGGHYGAVFIETVPPPGKGGAFVSRVERIGTLFYLTVNGDLSLKGSLESLKVPWYQAVAPILGTLRMRNDGNTHFVAEGTAQLSGPFGKVGQPVLFKGAVLPGTVRRFDLKLPSSTPIGLYKVTADVKYLDREETASSWMLLMPRVTFYIVCGTLILLLALAVWTMGRRVRKLRKPRLK
jgi:hypothetical protein